MQQGHWLQTLLPLVVIGGIMALRWRNLGKARPLGLRRMWVPPVLYLLLVAFVMAMMPPSATGWLLFADGAAIGGAIGWQRARLMRLHVDEASGAVMVRQSPAGLVMIVGILIARRIAMPVQQAPAASPGHLPASAMLATDALLGFALGMILGYRIKLWRRARALGN